MKIDENKYTSLMKDYIDKRFSNIRIHLLDIKNGYNANRAVDFIYLGVESIANFYLNGNKILNFFFELEFKEQEGLKEIIREKSKTGNQIDKSKFLARPHREYLNGKTRKLENIFADEGNRDIDIEKSCFKDYVERFIKEGKIKPNRDYHFISCRIKRVPENPNNLLDELWGYLISIPLAVATGFI